MISFHKLVITTLAALTAAQFVSGATDESAREQNANRRPRPTPTPRVRTVFDWENFESDIGGVAQFKDANLVNPWGIAVSSRGYVWIADNGTGVATVYYPDGKPFPNSASPLVVAIPASASSTEGANPTGIVSNSTPFFKVSNGTNALPAQFIFVSEDGVISGWNQQLSNTQAFVAVDNGPADAVYKGVTRGTFNNQNYLYATNFHSGAVETYDENFVLQAGFPFADPNLTPGFAPFGIRNLNGQIYVTYAKQDNPADADDDVPGPGNGFVDIFTTNGQFVKRLISGGGLNSPWGLELINGGLWVGNFGDGQINIYGPTSGNFVGSAKDRFGRPLQFDGLWALVFDNQALYFSAGIADEEHGLFGVIFPDF